MKKIFAILPIVALTCSMNANAGFLDGLSNVLGKTTNVLGKVTGTPASTSISNASRYQTAPMAQITSTQTQRISQLVQPNTTDKAVNQAIMEAKPNIEGVLRIASCQTSGVTLMAGKYQSPAVYTFIMTSVIQSMKYHPLNQCLTVSSIGNYKLESRDILTFNVVYASDVSPESRSMKITMKREPDGQWYVQSHM